MNKLFDYISKYKYIIMSIVLAVLVSIVVILLFAMNNNSSESQQPATTTINTETLSEKKNDELSGDSRFLVVCQEKYSDSIVFMTLVDFKIFGEKIIITPLDSETQTESGSFKEKYQYGGISMLMKAVEDERNITVDRYVIINKDGFCDIVDLMGEVDLYVDEEFTYSSSEKSYEIGIGNNTLEAPMLYSYLKTKYKNTNDIEFTDLLCKIINSYMNNFDTDKALSYFEDLSNCINSDLSIQDFYSAENDIIHLINGNTVCVPYYEGE